MRLARSLTRLAGALPYSLAVGAVGFAYLSPSGATGRLAPMPYRSAVSRIPGARTGASCPLPVSKQVKAVTAFREMMPVFRHPRCANCHGDFDIRSDRHPGSDVANSSGLDPRALLTVQQRKALHAGCVDCHDNIEGRLTRLDGTQLAGWLVAPQPMLWDGKDDEELCMQMKRFEPTGDQFVDHLATDHQEIQFIKAAFNGDRALGEGLKDYGLVAQPPPGTQADLVAKARKWVEILGDGYATSPECGCVVPKIKLEVHNVMERNVPNGLPSKEASDLKFEVSLLPLGEDKPGGYQGDVDVVRRVQVTVPGNCAVRGNTINEHWTFYAILQPNSDSMQVWHIQIPNDQEEGEIGCMVRPSGGWGNRRLSGKTDTVKTEEQWTESMLANAEPFMMPSDSGATQEFTDGEAGDFDRETLTITVLAVPR